MVALNTLLFKKKDNQNHTLQRKLTFTILFLFIIAFVSVEIHFQTVLKSAIEEYTVTKQIPNEFK